MRLDRTLPAFGLHILITFDLFVHASGGISENVVLAKSRTVLAVCPCPIV